LKMRIVMPILRFKPAIGGGEEHVYQIAKRLVSRGHEVIIYTSDLWRDSPKYIYLEKKTNAIEKICVRRFHAVKLLSKYPILLKLETSIIKEKADIIHAHGYGYYPCDLFAVVSCLRRIPFILTTHGFFPVTTPTNRLLTHVYIKLSEKNLLRVARKVICVSAEDAKYFTQLTDPRKLKIIPNGIDIESWKKLPKKKTFRAKYGIGGPLIMAVGRIVWTKGFQKLIQASSAVLKEYHDAVIVIAGEDFGYLSNLKQIAKKLGVYNSIIFTGYLSNEELKELYVDADVVTIPSLYEPFGIVALEAMACGKPIVASRTGGLVDFVKHGENGLLINPKNPKNLADAIIRLLQNHTLVNKIRDHNRIVVEIEKVYHEIIQSDR
jgi:glycosyltransferase involved in cell wall biosynthesis